MDLRASRWAACCRLAAVRSGLPVAIVAALLATSAAGAAERVERDLWDVFYLQKAKTGYIHTVDKLVDVNGKTRRKIEVLNKLSLKRFGQTTEQVVEIASTETADGQLIDFRTATSLGAQPIVIAGRVEGDRLAIETTTGDKRQKSSLPWSNDIGGFVAVERSLTDKPMRPGEQRRIKSLMPLVNQALVATNHLQAVDYETVELLTGRYRLLRIETRIELDAGQAIPSTIWTDGHGDTLKTRMDAMSMESYRGTRELALAESGDVGSFDLGFDTFVPVKPPLANPRHSRAIVYRVQLKNADPAAVFEACPTQRLKAIDLRTAQLTVTALSARGLKETAQKQQDDPPTKDDLTANGFIESDDARVQSLAKEVGATEDPVELAIALERLVHDRIKQKNFSQTLATAAQVAERLEGDCTEHAVLLAALARARGIPARVAVGLVYVPSAAGFGFHMWNELWLRGQWVGFDATLADGGIGADHLKLAHSSLGDDAALTCFLPVANVLGQLKVEVVKQ